MTLPGRKLAGAIFVLLLAACVTGWLWTRDSGIIRVAKKMPARTAKVSKIDQHLIDTARQMAAQADTWAEQELAAQAVHLADQELDEEFATAIREAAAITPPASGPLHDLAVRIAALRSRIPTEQQKIAQLTKEAASQPASASRLELAQAQLSLDQDGLSDAQEDLARQGGDEQAMLERAQQQLQSGRQGTIQFPKLTSGAPPSILRDQVQSWLTVGARQEQVTAAAQDAGRKANLLTQTHKALEGSLPAAPQTASDDDSDEDDPATVVAQLRHLSDQRKTLIDLDKRTQLCQQLAGVYQNWDTLLATRRRGVLHGLLGSLGIILAILLAATLVKSAVSGILAGQRDRRRLHQLRVVTRIAIHAVAAILILLVIFGAPTQTPTIIGLAGAGLTVVLKDFIVAFIGWFVLMGRNGIRLGDWVEINGVGGEVIEVGMLKTVLLEMGNWTVTGHPTGRRVSFMNSFAMEGHYFNFSTAGQWLWDELQVNLPSTGDPYQMAEQIRQVVERETENDARLAEQDWERVTHQYGTRVFSAKPASEIRPSATGLVVYIRYITRAPLRYEVKSRLFQAIVELMHKPEKLAEGV